MAAPLRKGGALVRQRLAGVAFVVVIALLVALTVALYQKRFADVVDVDLKTDAIGNQLTVNGDVKIRGLIVGRITGVSSSGSGSTISLAIDRDKAAMVPSDAVAQLVPKTLFGEKYVSLITTAPGAAGRPVRQGDVLQQDRSALGIETEEVLDDLLPLLKALKPEDLSRTLNALSGALRGRGNEIGANAVVVRDYLKALNPSLPTIQQDLVGLADAADTLDQAAPDFLAVLDDLSFSSRSLQDQQDPFTRFLTTSTAFSGSADSLLRQNDDRLISLAAENRKPLDLYARYSPEFGCFLRTMDSFQRIAEATLGGLQPGLRIKLEVTQDQGGYLPSDKPVNGDTVGPTCYGLDERLTQDITVYREAKDGYNDEAEAATPGVQNTRTGPGSEPNNKDGTPPPDGSSRSMSGRSVSAQSHGDLLQLLASPVLGLAPDQVPDLATLLLGPMARGTTVSYASR